MRFHIHTYGCQMNERDAESVRALLRRHGHEPAAGEDDADLVIVNTCSVRGKAEDKAIGKLGLLAATKRERLGRVVGAMGCMVQRLGGDVFRRVPRLDFAVGPGRLARLPGVLDLVRAGRGPVLDAGEERVGLDELEGHDDGGVCAYVNVLLGCDRRCAYCIVPSVRGGEWSRPAAAVLDEVRALAAAGVKDVTLLGQSVMSYGRRNAVWAADASPSPGGFDEPFARLVEAAAGVPGLARLRFTSGHPSGCTPQLARAMAAGPAACGHLHVPLQSGSDRVLALMRRGYTADGYRRAVAVLREHLPDIALTTDAIVGFPTESEADFEATRRLMEEIRFDNAFVFKYSPRPGTEAAGWPDDVPDGEKARRNQVLLADQDRRGQAINDGFVGRRVEVLAEGPSLRNAARWSGRTRGNKIVVFTPAEGVKSGDLVQVTVARARPQTLYGDLQGPRGGVGRKEGTA